MYNDTSQFGIVITYDNKRYEIPPIKESYQLSGIEIPFTFIKNEKNILQGSFGAIVYQLQQNNQEFIENSDIVFDLVLASPKQHKDWKKNLADLCLIKLHYSLESDWRMKYVGSHHAVLTLNHLKNLN